MAKFRYRMQNVLNIKLSMERQAKQQYAEANAKLREEEEKLNVLLRRKFEYEQTARQLLADELNVRDITTNNEAIARMDDFIKEQRREVQLAMRAVERARQKMTEVMQDRKTHERLREKAFDEFLMEEKHQESKEIDELVSYTYGQRLRETGNGESTGT
ncbi:MAG: flagellar export protein FliJ [bacterium]|nr:flagellar export protein FliJ [Clostridium sp.]MCM1538781.1 flagellar export protein FliJ [bacterium]